MLREIRVYGRLAKFLKRRVFHAEISSTAEAVRFLVTNFPQLEKHMADQSYRVSADDYEVGLEELHHPVGTGVIRIVPVLTGAGVVGRIVAGVALIAASFLFAPLVIAGIGLNSIAFGIGASLVLGGAAQLLTPVPKINQAGGSLGTPGSSKGDDTDPRKSYSFSGVQQTSRQGVPVPIVYGETLVGSVVISAGIDTVQVAT